MATPHRARCVRRRGAGRVRARELVDVSRPAVFGVGGGLFRSGARPRTEASETRPAASAAAARATGVFAGNSSGSNALLRNAPQLVRRRGAGRVRARSWTTSADCPPTASATSTKVGADGGRRRVRHVPRRQPPRREQRECSPGTLRVPTHCFAMRRSQCGDVAPAEYALGVGRRRQTVHLRRPRRAAKLGPTGDGGE